MRCIRIDIHGYKRLVNTGCNVDDRLVAFVGPNEAGKTSVLRALAWLDGPDSEPLPPGVASRAQEPSKRQESDEIVRATYRLDAVDWKAIGALETAYDVGEHTYHYARHRNGGRVHGLRPPLRRDTQPFARLETLLNRVPKALATALQEGQVAYQEGRSELDVEEAYALLQRRIQAPDSTLGESEVAALDSFARWLGELARDGGPKTFRQAVEQVVAILEVLESEHPNDLALQICERERPRFRQFTPADRDLPSEFDISLPEAPTPLKRVFDIAETDLDELKSLWEDEGARDTHLADCNDRLTTAFRKAWSQSNLAIGLKAEARLLKLQVKVEESGRTFYSTFGERSDGLKAFVALVGFLHDLPDATPPILLIDEAETHLHLDAQADLIQVLQDRIQATQVFYSTHSPGCLPLDLGRGLRFVEPEVDYHTSHITHNFWDSKHPGFSAVLFKMGAAAFAFSALRNAVLAEGAADMILLPSLLRMATGEETLRYQIAPRMNDFNEDSVRRKDVAANVVYLVDGDKGGRDNKKNLRRRHGVPQSLILSHPAGYAVEDYLALQDYLRVINELCPPGMSEQVRLNDLPEGETLGQRVDRWFQERGHEAPGKVAVATRLVSSVETPRLKPGAKAKLRALHMQIELALESRGATEGAQHLGAFG